MAIVQSEAREFAKVPESIFTKNGEEYRDLPYVLPFGKHQYYVPVDAFRSACKRTNQLETAENEDDVANLLQKNRDRLTPQTLGKIVSTRAPSKWYDSLHPDFLIQLEAPDGSSSCYTTFDVEGHPEERRILRLVNGSIAAKCFPMWKRYFDKNNIVPSNDRQKKRMDVLDWNKKEHCPDRAQLSPQELKWPMVGSIPEIEKAIVKSCRVDPPKANSKGGKGIKKNSQDTSAKYVKWEQFLDVGPRGTYVVTEMPGFLRVTQFNAASEAEPADEEEPAAEEEEE